LACSHWFDLSTRYEYAEVQLLLIKFNTITPGKKHTLSSSDVDFKTFRVLGANLIELCCAKFKMAKPRCCAEALFFIYVRQLKTFYEEKGKARVRLPILRMDARPCLYGGYYTALE